MSTGSVVISLFSFLQIIWPFSCFLNQASKRLINFIYLFKEPDFGFIGMLHCLSTLLISALYYFLLLLTHLGFNLFLFKFLRWEFRKLILDLVSFLTSIYSYAFPCKYFFRTNVPHIPICCAFIFLQFKIFSNFPCDFFFESGIIYVHTVYFLNIVVFTDIVLLLISNFIL